MEMHNGTPIRDALIFLRKKYGISVIGKTKTKVDSLIGQRAYILSKKRLMKSVKINCQMRISELQWLLSKNVHHPVVLSSELIVSIPADWNLKQFVKRSNGLHGGKTSSKKQLILSLIGCAETFADVDGILRVAKKSRLTYDDDTEKKSVLWAIGNNPGFFSEDQRNMVYRSLVEPQCTP